MKSGVGLQNRTRRGPVISVPLASDPLRASQGSVKETGQAVYYLISLTQSKRTANCLHRSAMPSNVGKKGQEAARNGRFVHLPKPLRPNIRWPDCLHGFQVGKGKQINLAVVPGQTLGLQVGESPTAPHLVLMRAACQGRAGKARRLSPDLQERRAQGAFPSAGAGTARTAPATFRVVLGR